MRTLNKRRKEEQAKYAERLEPKGTVAGKGAEPSPFMGKQRHRRSEANLTLPGIQAEHGKPVALPTRVSKPQGMRDELRVEEDGKSEGHPVMGWIEVASQKRQHHLARKRADFHQRSFLTRKFD